MLVVSFVSLGCAGIVVAMSVPLVLLGAVAIMMLATGWNLERVSLGSLIIALGLLVDDAIIALEMMMVKMEPGWDQAKAAAYSYTATAMPRLTGALITVAAFMPIGFSKSTTGEYAGRHLLDRRHGRAVLLARLGTVHAVPGREVPAEAGVGKHHEHAADPYDTPFYRKLRGWIELALEKRWMVIGVTVSLAIAQFCMRFVPQQFFPNSSRPELIVELRVKEGASFAATTEQVKKMEALLAKDEDVRFFTATQAPARRASICRSTPSCRTRAMRSSS